MKYKFIKQIKNNSILRSSFFQLAKNTFGLSFENWYEQGFWTDKYIPYSIIDGDKVISNASVNVMDMIYGGSLKRFIQIGTVMTAPNYRNRGLCSFLIKEILSDWCGKCEYIYLFANSTVLDFYPKFGFVRAYEYECILPICHKSGDFIKLNMSNPNDIKILKECYSLSNPYSKLASVNNFGLLMFYCSDIYKDCIYYSNKNKAVCIADNNADTLECLDIFGKPECDLSELLSLLANNKIVKARLGFTPVNSEGCTFSKLENDDALFILPNANILEKSKLMFPELSHA